MLKDINPDVDIEYKTCDITKLGDYEAFVQILRTGGKVDEKDGQGEDAKARPRKKVDLVLGCVDNFGARMAINSACCEEEVEWIESGVSEEGVAGHVQYVKPGLSACFACSPPLIVASGIPESTLKREGVCAASLPTTMAMVAAMQVQEALKRILLFGKLSFFLGYSALSDYFPSYTISPNPECDNAHCLRLQHKLRTQREAILQKGQKSSSSSGSQPHVPKSYAQCLEEEYDFRVKASEEAVSRSSEENEWGIEVVASSSDASSPSPSDSHQPLATDTSRLQGSATIQGRTGEELPEGLSHSYDKEGAGRDQALHEIDHVPLASSSSDSSTTPSLTSSLAELRMRLRNSQQKS